tara:strand:- start:331 stop:603 length:273 start_codon:yes stop_codon:yes gene_type:complete
MKPSKKRPAKRPSNPIVTKLLNLKYRINEAYRSGHLGEEGTKNDKTWVVDKLNDVRGGIVLTKGEMLHCNNLWKEYSPSRLNDWVGYKNG